LLEVGAEISIVRVPLLAENYGDGMLVLYLVERGCLVLSLPVEKDCLMVPLRAARHYFDLVVLLPAEDFCDVVE
jgi:hypothetical protein